MPLPTDKKAPRKAPSAKKAVKAAPKKIAKEKPVSSGPRVSSFTEVPSVSSVREYKQTYPFDSLKPGMRILIDVSDEREARNARANLYGAFYRYQTKNPDAINWNRTIRVGRDDNRQPINVGFYRSEAKVK